MEAFEIYPNEEDNLDPPKYLKLGRKTTDKLAELFDKITEQTHDSYEI